MDTTSYPPILKDGWREYLRVRGVSDEAIAERGYQWVYPGKALDGSYSKAYGFPQASSGLLIPLHPLLGGDAYQLRQSAPQPDRNGKVLKFLTPYRQANTLNTSPLIDPDEFRKSHAFIVIAEGITRVDALAAYRIPALGLGGSYGWRGTNKSKGLTTLADWEEVSIKGSRFLIAFDGDLTSNLDVWRAADRLCRFLRGKGADTVKLLCLPDGAGLDDWVATNGPFEDAEALLVALRQHWLDDMPQRPPFNVNGQEGLPQEQSTEVAELNGTVSINGTRRLKVLPYHAGGMKEILNDLKLEVRKNVRAERVEIRRTDNSAEQWLLQWGAPANPGWWAEASAGILAEIETYSRRFILHTKVHESSTLYPLAWAQHALEMALLELCKGNYVDPYLEWLNELPKWDGRNRIEGLWVESLGMPDKELNRQAGRRFMVGMVRRAFEPGCVHDWIPVLVGPQGLGKTSMIKSLLSADEWYSGSTLLTGTAKERWESTGPAVISEFQDMAGLDKVDTVQFISWLSNTQDRFRPAFGKGQGVTVARRWVGAGTSNDRTGGVLPYDNTGARRYVVMESEYKGTFNELEPYSRRAREWVEEHRVQLHAEALAAYREANEKGDYAMNTVGHLREKQEAAARGYFSTRNETMENKAGDAALADYARMRDGSTGATISELMLKAGIHDFEKDASKDRSGQLAFADALKGDGWEKKQTTVAGKRAMRWMPPHLATPSEPEEPEEDRAYCAGPCDKEFPAAELSKGLCGWCGVYACTGSVGRFPFHKPYPGGTCSACGKADFTTYAPYLPSASSIDIDGFIVATVGEDRAVMHAHFCNKAEGWVHHADLGLQPANCESCKVHLSDHNKPLPGQSVMDGMPAPKREYH